MREDDSPEIILKVLTGVQSGMDILLVDGEYTLGSSDSDDIQLFDVSVLPGHARLAVRRGKVEVAAAAGLLRTGSGLVFEPDSNFQEIELLDLISAGTSHFVVGMRSSNWSSVVDASGEHRLAGANSKPLFHRNILSRLKGRRSHVALAIAGTLIISAAVVTSLYGGSHLLRYTNSADAASDLANVQKALAKLAFARRLHVHQEIDGVVYVNGFVETPAERRAVLAAIRGTNVPARARVSVLSVTRAEIASLLESENVKISFELSDDGVVKLRGTVLDEKRAMALPGIVRERVFGVSEVRSELQTGPAVLADVKQLAERSQIAPLVIFNLQGALIEASGVVPREKIDAWAGFLQAYANRFAATVPLRSLVTLQATQAQGSTVADGPPLYLDATGDHGDGVDIDVSQLKDGNFDPNDIFVGGAGKAGAGATAAMVDDAASAERLSATGERSGAKPGSSGVGGDDAVATRSRNGAAVRRDQSDESANGKSADLARQSKGQDRVKGEDPAGWEGSGGKRAQSTLPQNAQDQPVAPDPAATSRALIERWQLGALKNGAADARLADGMAALENHAEIRDGKQSSSLKEHYASLLARGPASGLENIRCWPGSNLTTTNVAGIIFWLDLLSASDSLSFKSIDSSYSEALLEAALSPARAKECLAQANASSLHSVYLYEVSRNSEFVRHITRDLPELAIDLTGVNLGAERYIQTREGQKLTEGAAPDASSRLLIIGELGLAFERRDGYAVDVFGSTLNWMAR